MEITFASTRLKQRCESGRELQRFYGKPCAKKLMARLADLAAAPTLADFRGLPGHCHELDGDRKGQLALDLAGGKRLVVTPARNPAPVKDDSGLDWELVDAIRVVEITDYH